MRDTDKEFEKQGVVLKMITNKNYNVDLAKLSDKKLLYGFAKEKPFDEKALGNKSTGDKSPKRLLESPGIMVSAAGVSTSHKENLSQKQDDYHLILTKYVID